MSTPTIRPARPDEYDEIARIWMNSWASTGLEEPSHFLLAKLRARVALEVEKAGRSTSPTMAERLRRCWRCICPFAISIIIRRAGISGPEPRRRLLAFTRQHLANEITLRCVRENEKAWRWYEREGLSSKKNRSSQ